MTYIPRFWTLQECHVPKGRKYVARAAGARPKIFGMRVARILAASSFALLVASCGGGGGYGGTVSQPPPPPPAGPLAFTETGMAVIKVRASTDGVTLMEEKAAPLTEIGPQRRITLLDAAGAVRARYSPPAGSSLVDFAQHASGEITVALATARTVTLVRLDRGAAPSFEFPLVDSQAPSDPYVILGDGVHDDTSMVPVLTRDAIRLAPTGQDGGDLVVALRTGRNAVVAYRLAFATPGGTGYSVRWRTLVEPGVTMLAIGITSGTFDTFGQLENHLHVHVDADAAGNVAVAVAGKPESAPIFIAHGVWFHEAPVTAIQSGALVTRLAPDGQRIGTTPIDTTQVSELHGIRLHPNGVALVGRVFSEKRDDGTGWNAYVANVDASSGFYRVLDIDAGDALFDIARADAGRYLAGGTTGYTQNPTGASVSEQSKPLLLLLEADGSVRQRIDVPAGARQNQVRSIWPRGGNWLVGSLVNGPGTHSGDANPALITADGAAREITVGTP